MKTLTKGTLTWIIPSEREGVWLDAARQLVGIDDDDGLTSWYTLAGKLVEVKEATDEQIEVAEQYATE